MVRDSARGLACMIAMAGCAAGSPEAKPIAAGPASTPPPVEASVTIELEVEDSTRKEHWLETLLDEELVKRKVIVWKADVGEPARRAPYVLRVRVEVRGSDHGVVVEKAGSQRGSTRLDGAGPDQEGFREPPAPETRPYTRQGEASGRTTEAVDDFRITMTATIMRRASSAVVATASFDEAALGLAPVPKAGRGGEWQAVYRGAATRIASWLRAQQLP